MEVESCVTPPRAAPSWLRGFLDRLLRRLRIVDAQNAPYDPQWARSPLNLCRMVEARREVERRRGMIVSHLVVGIDLFENRRPDDPRGDYAPPAFTFRLDDVLGLERCEIHYVPWFRGVLALPDWEHIL